MDCDELSDYVARHIVFSTKIFGRGLRTEALCKHIEKELAEIRKAPEDLTEWVDVMILAIDGYWRAGGTCTELINHLVAKQVINFRRSWPAPTSKDEPVEHIRKLTERQEDHLNTLICLFNEKFRRGAAEHEDDLLDKSTLQLLDEAIDEVIDQFTYLMTAREKLFNEQSQD